jgi:hypothetical protein
MDFEIPWRRIAAGGFVLLLHLLFIFALILALRLPAAEEGRHLRELVLTLMTPHMGPKERQQNLNIPTPKFVSPETLPRAITLLPPALREQAPAPQGDIRGLGRYLTNCSDAYYEQLSPRERAGCLSNKWEEKASVPDLLLGPRQPSPFDAIITRRRTPAQSIEHPCAPDSPTANLGLPCYNFSGH